MQAIVQRVRGSTKIQIDGQSEGFEGPGLVVLLGWHRFDTNDVRLLDDEEWIRSRVEGLRIFPDEKGRMNLSLESYLAATRVPGQPEGGGILWVPQFTLAARLESGFRPSFTDAMEPARAQERFDGFVKRCREVMRPYGQVFGSFGADMALSFTNWGPVTIPLTKITSEGSPKITSTSP